MDNRGDGLPPGKRRGVVGRWARSVAWPRPVTWIKGASGDGACSELRGRMDRGLKEKGEDGQGGHLDHW